MESPFLGIEDIDVSRNETIIEREDVRKNRIDFDFPAGFQEIPFIEELRALQCMDWQTNTDSLDVWFDVMMQLLTEKPVVVLFKNDKGVFEEVWSFVVTNRYMNLNGVELFRQYPILGNWMIAKVAYLLEKKFPRSLADIQMLKSDHSQPTNMPQEKEKTKKKTQTVKSSRK